MNLAKIEFDPLPERVKQWCEENANNRATLFCAYLEYYGGEIVERCFATRRYGREKVVKVTEVTRFSTGVSSLWCKNLIYSPMAGYRAVYEKKDVVNTSYGYTINIFKNENFGVWYNASTSIGFNFKYINPDMILSIPELKYCGYSGRGSIISYVNAYRKDKNVEFFGKMGLPLSPVLMNKAKKDGAFRRFLWENHNGIALYGVQAALFAYKNGITVEEARRACLVKNQLDRLAAYRIPEIKGTNLDRLKVIDYVDKNHIEYASYNDYLKALKALKLDLNDTKNLYPNDFRRMHDLRAAEYASYEAKLDRKKRKALYSAFKKKATEYLSYEIKTERYTLTVPRDISDLIYEGNALSHCVGKMGYDKRMADGVSLIMFCRKAEAPDTPFVTVEYRLDTNRLNQCYGYKDSRPDDDVIAFVNEWANNLKEIRRNERKNKQRPAAGDRPQVG